MASTTLPKESAEHLVAICHLYAAQENLAAAFTQSAYLEINQRVRDAKFSKKKYIEDQIDARIVRPCLQQSQAGRCQGNDILFALSIDDRQCRVNNFSRCYEEKYPIEMKKTSQELFPNDGNCQM